MDDVEPVRRSVKVRCRQRLNPDGSLLISKSLTVRSTHNPHPSPTYTDPHMPQIPHRDVYTAHISGIVLNESLRPKQRTTGRGLTAPPPLSRSISLPVYSGSSFHSVGSAQEPPAKLSPAYSNASILSRSLSCGVPSGIKLNTVAYPQSAFIEDACNLLLSSCSEVKHSGGSGRSERRSTTQLSSKGSANSVNCPKQTRITESFSSSNQEDVKDQNVAKEMNNSKESVRPISAQYSIDSDQNYRAYSHEVFMNAPKLLSFGSTASSPLGSAEETIIIERPRYFIDIRSQTYDISAILEEDIIYEEDEQESIRENDKPREGQLLRGPRSSDESRTSSTSVSDEDLSLNSISID